jgi:general secretion pathway protein A
METSMYNDFFGLDQEPFRLTPDPQFFFLGEHHNRALAHLLYGINHRKGFIALTGEVGSGKTTLCRSLLKQLDDNVSVAIILNSLVDEITFLKQINRDFAIPYDTDSHDDLFGYLYDFLILQKRKGGNVVVIVDECQNLKFEVLEQIRMLSNLETEKDKLLQILLIGQPEFLDMLDSHALRQLNQRITVRAHIAGLDRDEMEKYIYHRLRVAGNENAARFTRGALKRIFRFSSGIPRKINVICEYALLAGYVNGTRIISSAMVKQALRDIEIKRQIQPGEEARAVSSRTPLRTLLLAALLLLTVMYFQDPLRQTFSHYGELFKTPLYANVIAGIQELKARHDSLPALSPRREVPEAQETMPALGKPSSPPPSPVPSEAAATSSGPSETAPRKTPVDEPAAPTTNEEGGESETKTPEASALETSVSEAPISVEPGDASPARPLPPEASRAPGESAGGLLSAAPPRASTSSATTYFRTLEPRERGIWLLLSTWGIEITHPRKEDDGTLMSLEDQLARLNFTLFTSWADLDLLLKINLPCALEIERNGRRVFWVLNAAKQGLLRFYTAPETMELISVEDLKKIWQGNALLLVERGENTLVGEQALFKGMESEAVRRLKGILSRLGYYRGDADPLFDLQLEKAIQEFQRATGLTPDGIVGVEAKLLFYSLLTAKIPRLLEYKAAEKI